jgi:predicted ATPase
VLEDLHWADATSLSLVPFVARALPRRRLADEGLEPTDVAVFGGALRFSRHGR